jgi:AraC-like DNA-binding protein
MPYILHYTDEQYLESNELPFYCATHLFINDEQIPLHYHDFVEMVYVAEGSGLHEYKGERYRISKGDMFVIEPGVPHAYKADAGHFLVYNLLFQPLILESELHALSKVHSFLNFFYIEPFFRKYADFQTRLSLDQHEHLEIMMHLDKLVQEFTHKSMGYPFIIKSRLLELFVTLSRFYSTRTNKQWPPVQDEHMLFEDISRFIKIHYAQPISLEEVCRLSGMGITTFSFKFKNHFQKTFLEYRNGIRIDVAKDLLARTKDKVSSISGHVGFEDLSFFNRLFRRETGLSPNQYRKTNQ